MKYYYHLQVLGFVVIGLSVVLALLAWGLNRVLLIASQDGQTQIFRVITCYGFVISQKERTPDKTGPVIVQLVDSIDSESKAPIERRLILLDRFAIAGFSSRDGGLRFAKILA
ncbi:MAG TPA: hypothetical protein VLA12_18965, partial [Planctomycetaceae bacterium]|nr:hypothetical protein [Planctomycetaceae bacterium]